MDEYQSHEKEVEEKTHQKEAQEGEEETVWSK